MLISLTNYSGITTKVRGMRGKLLSYENFSAMASLPTTKELLHYLISHSTYAKELKTIDETKLHRGDIEKRLIFSMYHDYAKLYSFASGAQRKFMDIYFLRFEISALKLCLRKIFDARDMDYDLSEFKNFFEHHSKLDIPLLFAATDIREFLNLLRDTEFYSVLANLSEHKLNLFDYEMQLELYYFTKMWKLRDKFLSHNDLKSITQTFGSQIDMLNILWIYRFKRYYNIDNGMIYAYLIPIRHKLTRDQLNALIEANTMNDFYTALKDTSYKDTFEKIEQEKIESLYYQALIKLYKTAVLKFPYSAAIVTTYMFHKELEIHNITSIIEGVRYELDSKDIMDYIYIYK